MKLFRAPRRLCCLCLPRKCAEKMAPVGSVVAAMLKQLMKHRWICYVHGGLTLLLGLGLVGLRPMLEDRFWVHSSPWC